MIAAAAFVLGLAVPPLPAVRATSANAARYVRLRLDVVAYGIPGRGEILIDRDGGRFVRRFDAGAVSDREGFDGARAWRADSTGMARVQGNADQRGAIVAASYLYARAPRPATAVAFDGSVRLGYRGLSRTMDVRAGAPGGQLVEARRRVGEDTVLTTFAGYRTVAGLRVPFALSEQSSNGTWTARVRSVEPLRDVPRDAFAPPPPPHDATLAQLTRIPLDSGEAIAVRIDGSAPMRFLLDTGGQNVITPQAAARLGMTVSGHGSVGGAGAGIAPTSYTTARSVRIGAAELRDQPFVVLDLGPSAPFEGIVGYEVFARFAARLDFARHTLELAPSAAAFGTRGTAVPMVFDDRQPQVSGAIDGLPAQITIDTGSDEAVDVNTPFVRAHRLELTYRVTPRGMLFYGVGGGVDGWRATARELRLGTVVVRDVRLALTDARAGVEMDPSIAANVGDQVLHRFTMVFDYRNALLRFSSP
jgi:predicted aspartyl protease